MGGVQGRCPVHAGRVSSQFVSRNSSSSRTISIPFPLILSSPSLSVPLACRLLYGAPWRFFVNFLAIERLGEGGARQSTRWMNLRRMQIRASPRGISALKIKLYACDNSTTRQLLVQRYERVRRSHLIAEKSWLIEGVTISKELLRLSEKAFTKYIKFSWEEN